MVQIKSKRELEIMRECGRRVSVVLSKLSKRVEPGISLIELDREAELLSKEVDAEPAFKGYLGYPFSLCTSVNDQVVHGMPTKRTLKEGDIVGLDFGLIFDGFYGDSAVTIPVGVIPSNVKTLVLSTLKALYSAIHACRAGNTLQDLARSIEGEVTPKGYGIVREFVGHGIGRKLHEDPQVPNYLAGASNLKLRPGMTIAIEPMINEGTHQVKILGDKWTAVTLDGKWSAHFEHTLAITEDEPEILTEWESPFFGGLIDKLM